MNDVLNTALGYHQRGLLDQAARVYQAILAQNPDHADALHLLGVVALQRGHPARAVEHDRPGRRPESRRGRLPRQPGRGLPGVRASTSGP